MLPAETEYNLKNNQVLGLCRLQNEKKAFGTQTPNLHDFMALSLAYTFSQGFTHTGTVTYPMPQCCVACVDTKNP